MCNLKTKPEFTKDQQAECQKCNHISGKKIWCCLFGCFIDGREEKRIRMSSRKIITPDDKIKLPSFVKSGCCGKAKNIAIGWQRYLQGKSWPWSQKRRAICLQCPEVTYLKRTEYAIWLAKQNIKFVKNFNQLEALPALPKKPYTPGTEPYCRICKCNVEAKTRVELEFCKLKKWGPVQKPALIIK